MEWPIGVMIFGLALFSAAGGYTIGYLVGWDKATAYWIAFMRQHDR